MRKGATKTQIDHVVDRLRERGYGANLSGSEVSVIGAIGVYGVQFASSWTRLGSSFRWSTTASI